MFWKLYLLAHPKLLLIFLTLYPIASFGPWAQSLDVSGRVLDPETGKPIAEAKVVISAWNLTIGPYDSSPHKFLVTTNIRGEFHLARKFDFLISRVGIEVCAPDGRFASLGSSAELDLFFNYEMPTRPGVDRYFYFPGKGHFEMRVYELPDSHKKRAQLRYETFRGALGGEPESVSQ